MYKIIKLTLWGNVYHYEIIDENENKIIYSTKAICKTLRELIISFIELHNNYKMLPIRHKYFKYETIDTLESLDLEYIKNKYIHSLI